MICINLYIHRNVDKRLVMNYKMSITVRGSTKNYRCRYFLYKVYSENINEILARRLIYFTETFCMEIWLMVLFVRVTVL